MERRLSDADLWRNATSGSDDAFGKLFERHASAIYNYCFRRVGDWTTAEDLMAATFLEAWRKRDQIKLVGESLRPWLLGVATNLLRNQWRTNRRREAALRRVRLDVQDGAFEDEVAARLDDEHRIRELNKLLSVLPSDYVEVIALVLWSGLEYAEAAIALGVPVGTVKSRLARARRKLAELANPSGHSQSEMYSDPVPEPQKVEP